MSRAKTAVEEFAGADDVAATGAGDKPARGNGGTTAPAPTEGKPAAKAAESGAAGDPGAEDNATAGPDRAAATTATVASEPAEAETAPATASDPTAEPDPAATTTGEPTTADATASEPTDSEVEAAEPAAAETDPAEAGAEAEPAKPRPVWRRLPALLLAAALVLTGAGVWFTLEARSAAANSAAANLALTDVAATADVTSAVTLAVNRIFSYSYDRTDVTEKAAAAVLRGSAKDSYDKLFAEVRRKAPEQKLVLTSRVSAIAVQELKNGHARLLVFLDQSAVRADNNATDSAAAQLSVTAEHTNDGWVITELEPR